MISLLSALVAIAGSGGLSNTPVSNYTRDQGWGMGHHVGAIPSVVGGHDLQLSHVGTVFHVDEESLPRWKRWYRHVMRDQLVVWLPACFFGMALPSMLSVNSLARGTVVPDKWVAATLTAAGGLVAGATFLHIVAGTLLGNELVLPGHGVTIGWITVGGVAVAGFVASLYTPPAPPAGAIAPVDWVFPRAIWQLIRLVRGHPPAFRAILAIAWFWFLGATFLSLLPAYARDTLGADEGVLTALLAGFSIGVALGAVASERLGRGEVNVNLPPIGALGLALMAVELWLATHSQPFVPAPALIDRAAFFDTVAGWRILADFIILAAFAGIYVTPLNAVLQREAPEQRRARFIAASNVVDATMIVTSALIVTALLQLGLSPIDILALFTLSGLPMSFAVARYAPATQLGKVALMLWPRGPQ